MDTLSFSKTERDIYDSIYHSAKKDFEQLRAKGLVGKNYSHILAMLMRYENCHFASPQSSRLTSDVRNRLRRAVLHPSLVLSDDDEENQPTATGPVDVDSMIEKFTQSTSDSKGDESTPTAPGNAFAEGVLNNLSNKNEEAECPLCMDVMDHPMMFPECMHQWSGHSESLLSNCADGTTLLLFQLQGLCNRILRDMLSERRLYMLSEL